MTWEEFAKALGGEVGGQVKGNHWTCAECTDEGDDGGIGLYHHRQRKHVRGEGGG